MRILGICVLLTITACNGRETLELGSEQERSPSAGGYSGSTCNSFADSGTDDWGTVSSDDAGSDAAARPTATGIAVDGSAGALLGQWQGYVESYQFPSGSDAVTVTFDASSDGTVMGHIAFGSAPPPPPPTDPNVGYPPGYYDVLERQPWEGFVYTVLAGTFDGERLKFDISDGELWQKWCPLQTSYGTSSTPSPCGGEGASFEGAATYGPRFQFIPYVPIVENMVGDATTCTIGGQPSTATRRPSYTCATARQRVAQPQRAHPSSSMLSSPAIGWTEAHRETSRTTST